MGIKSDTKSQFVSMIDWKWESETLSKEYRNKLLVDVFQNVQHISMIPARKEWKVNGFIGQITNFIYTAKYVCINPVTKKHINVTITCFYKLNEDGVVLPMRTSIHASTSCGGVNPKALQFDILSINTWEKTA